MRQRSVSSKERPARGESGQGMLLDAPLREHPQANAGGFPPIQGKNELGARANFGWYRGSLAFVQDALGRGLFCSTKTHEKGEFSYEERHLRRAARDVPRFFQERGHAVIASASVIPENDPTVLFTTAGMHPLVPYLLGAKHPEGTRLTDVQKCIRTGDIDEVCDASHLTFLRCWATGPSATTSRRRPSPGPGSS